MRALVFSSSVDALVFFSFDGQFTKDVIYKKIEWLGLEVVDQDVHNLSTTTFIELPEELSILRKKLMNVIGGFLNRPGRPFPV